jgi:hypothetical protein
MRIPLFSGWLSNTRMKTVEEIRRERLAMLRAECGTLGALAERLDKSGPQVSQWLNASTNSGTGKARGISSDECRKIEEKFDKPRGWMDSDPDRVDAAEIVQLIGLYLRSTENGQNQILKLAEMAEKLPKL